MLSDNTTLNGLESGSLKLLAIRIEINYSNIIVVNLYTQVILSFDSLDQNLF